MGKVAQVGFWEWDDPASRLIANGHLAEEERWDLWLRYCRRRRGAS